MRNALPMLLIALILVSLSGCAYFNGNPKTQMSADSESLSSSIDSSVMNGSESELPQSSTIQVKPDQEEPSGVLVSENSVFWDNQTSKPSPSVSAIYRDIPQNDSARIADIAKAMEDNSTWLQVSELSVPILHAAAGVDDSRLAGLLAQEGIDSKIASAQSDDITYRFIGIWLYSEANYSPYYYAYLQTIEDEVTNRRIILASMRTRMILRVFLRHHVLI